MIYLFCLLLIFLVVRARRKYAGSRFTFVRQKITLGIMLVNLLGLYIIKLRITDAGGANWDSNLSSEYPIPLALSIYIGLFMISLFMFFLIKVSTSYFDVYKQYNEKRPSNLAFFIGIVGLLFTPYILLGITIQFQLSFFSSVPYCFVNAAAAVGFGNCLTHIFNQKRIH